MLGVRRRRWSAMWLMRLPRVQLWVVEGAATLWVALSMSRPYYWGEFCL